MSNSEGKKEEIIDHIERIRDLYQGDNYSLSDLALSKLEEMVDDYRRIENE